MYEKGFIEDYKDFIDCYGQHEIFALDYINEIVMLEDEYEEYDRRRKYKSGDKIIFNFRDKLVALVVLGKDLSSGSNLIVSHVDSPRLDVIPNDPLEIGEDGVFFKTIPYGGIIPQLWLDRPLVMVGRAYDDDHNLVRINTGHDKIFFSITSLLPHLNGRKELKEMTSEKLKVRMTNGNSSELFDYFENIYGLNKKNLELADLSFVPYGDCIEMGFDKDLIMGYGHDDSSCTFASLEAMLDSKPSDKTKIALFVSYEETGSGQLSGAQSQFIDDIFLQLAEGDMLLARECMRNTRVISADVTSGYDSNYSSHFEHNAKAVVGEGVALVPFLGSKRGNDSSIQMREHIKRLCEDNDIKYQIESTKPSEGGGGTVSTFFATRGMEALDIAVPTLAMHSPMEQISKRDLIETYKLYKAFLES